MSKPHEGEHLRVAMAVASDIIRDARVKKTALAVADAGHDVVLLYGRGDADAPANGRLGPVRTIGIDVPYAIRDSWAAGFRIRSATGPGAHAREKEDALALLHAELRSMRAANSWLGRRAAAAASRALVRIRSNVHKVQRKARTAMERPRRSAAPDPDWRSELPNVGDLDLAFTRALWRLRPDILHIHDIHLLEAGVLAARRLRSRGHPVLLVYDAHEYVAGMAPTRRHFTAAWTAMELELMPEVDAVITVSDPIADAMQQRFDLPIRPTVVLNTPALRDQRPAPVGVREACNLLPEVPLLVYSGVLNPRRGVVTAVDALTHLPDVHLAVVCVPGPHAPTAQALHSYARAAGVEDRAHLVEPVDTDQIVDYLSSADVGVHPMIGGLPNHEMALPNKLFDYLHAGLPVVVSDVRLMGEFVRGRGLGEPFLPQDAQDLARAVRLVLAAPTGYRKNVADAALREEFSWEAQAGRLHGLYAELEGRAATSPADDKRPHR